LSFPFRCERPSRAQITRKTREGTTCGGNRTVSPRAYTFARDQAFEDSPPNRRAAFQRSTPLAHPPRARSRRQCDDQEAGKDRVALARVGDQARNRRHNLLRARAQRSGHRYWRGTEPGPVSESFSRRRAGRGRGAEPAPYSQSIVSALACWASELPPSQISK